MRASDCQWRMTDVARNIWAAQCCGRTHFFVFGGPFANSWKTCPFCGGYVVELANA